MLRIKDQKERNKEKIKNHKKVRIPTPFLIQKSMHVSRVR